MTHSPKLSGYIIRLRPENDSIDGTNRSLFRALAGMDKNGVAEDAFLFTEMFRVFISKLDTPKMYSEPRSKKCMTANQANIEQEHVNTNIHLHSDKYIIEGKVEGGTYGKKRNKTSTTDKSIKSLVGEGDAITSDFYFFLYSPPFSSKSVLFLQSYTDDSIDPVMKNFWQSFFAVQGTYNKPRMEKYIPHSIIEKFKKNSTVSGLQFTTEIPASTLIGKTKVKQKQFKVEIKITPVGADFSIDEYGEIVEPIQNKIFASRFKLSEFRRRKGNLRDQVTSKTSKFEIGSDFDVHPTILLSKFVTIEDNDSDFERIRDFCLGLLEEVKQHVYTSDAVKSR